MKHASLALGLATAASATVELGLSKRDLSTNGATQHVARGLVKRQSGGTVSTDVFDALTWSSGGAYYINSKEWPPPGTRARARA